MIFPEHCKHIGVASAQPCGDKVYFLSRYLLHETPEGPEVLEVELNPAEKGMMRTVLSSRVLAAPGDVCQYPEKVNLFNRARLIELALEQGCRCTIFTGLDEHRMFVLDPDESGLLAVHVYDAAPPRPSLSACIRELEADGMFGSLGVKFHHHVRDIAAIRADVYPCRAAGFEKTLDADPMQGGERLAGCLTGSQFYRECHGSDFHLENICPLDSVTEEPFIARCCRSERGDLTGWNGKTGAIVHWGADPARIYQAVTDLIERWRKR